MNATPAPAELPETAGDNIQGVGLAGFRKDHQELLFVRFGTEKGALLHRRSHRRRLQPPPPRLRFRRHRLRDRMKMNTDPSTMIASPDPLPNRPPAARPRRAAGSFAGSSYRGGGEQ